MTFFELRPLLDYLEEKSDKKIFIWGGGAGGELLGQVLNQCNVKWIGYYDNFIAPGTILNGKPIFSPADFTYDGETVYIISTVYYYDIKRQLTSYGVPDGMMIWFEKSDFLNTLVDFLDFESQCVNSVKNFSDIFHGKSCFLIGNGPSLQIKDLEKIGEKGYCAFASNSFFQCYDKTDWRPNYYVMGDKYLLRHVFEERDQLHYILKNCGYMFTRQDSALFSLRNEPELNNLIYVKFKYPQALDELEFSPDCEKYICGGANVGFMMLQLAVYMGFKKIYLLGMDNTSSRTQEPDGTIVEHPEVVDHASIFKHYDRPWLPSRLYMVTMAYQSAKRYADAHGIEIYNATRGGQLEVFPRVDFDELMG